MSVKFDFTKHMKKRTGSKQSLISLLISFIVTLVVGGILFYVFLPAINIKNLGFYFFLVTLIVVFMVINDTVCATRKELPTHKGPIGFILLIALIVIGSIAVGHKMLRAKEYANLLKVSDGEIGDIPSVEATSSIALMDTASAEKLGDREIGSLTSVVSQFNVGEYVQIDYQSVPAKVAPLEYEGFFKWMGNRNEGVPGYVTVDPVTMSADYKSLNNGMKYVPSAYFHEDLMRHIRFAYPFTMFGNLHFEIDEEGNPWYIASVYDHTISLFSGTKIIGAIIVNPFTGETDKLGLDEIPQWADVIFPGDLIIDQYNYSAQLQRGFWNSIFGQVDSKQTTTIKVKDDDGDSSYQYDYGYIAKDGDIWIFTGVTSVNGDSSNLGFIMANERTSETKYISVPGADEGSAMSSAEGEVQEKGYHASFPSLINVDDVPTYIMVLKDDNGLVKMYACVNVRQYNLVATATTQKEVINQYRRLISGGVISEGTDVDTSDFTIKKIIVSKLEKIDIDGNTYLYIVADDNHIYRAKYADVIGMINVSVGDEITILTNGDLYVLSE